MKTSKLLSHTLCVCEREDKYIYTHTQSATQNYYVFKKKHLFIPVTDEKKKREKTQNIREKSNRDRIGRESWVNYPQRNQLFADTEETKETGK